MRLTIFLPTLIGAVLAAVPVASAKDLVDPVNKDRHGVAIRGYDAVAYFSASEPVKGAREYTYNWRGAEWRFQSAEHRDLFATMPERYAPQFGGYCAWAVSNNYTAEIDPQAWKIVDGRLYLNYSKSVQRMWEKEIPQRIAAGNRNWPELHK